MRASTSYNGKVIVKTTESLKGRGITFSGKTSKGENKYYLTQTAYEKIQHLCVYEK